MKFLSIKRYVLRQLGLDTPTEQENKESSDETENRTEKKEIKVLESDFEKFKMISQGACKSKLH